MNEQKIKQLFKAVRTETVPEAPFSFSRSVVSAIQRESRSLRISFADQLSGWFPRIAFAAILLIGFCAAADVYIADQSTTLTAAVEQVAADEWLLAEK